MKKRTISIFFLLYLFAGIVIGWKLCEKADVEEADIAEVNKIVKEVEKHKDHLQQLNSIAFGYDFNVLNSKDEMCYQQGHYSDRTKEEAIRHHNTYDQVENLLVLIKTTKAQGLIAHQNELSFCIIVLYVMMGLVLVGFCLLFNRRYFLPFRKMEEFAHQVANGNLDYPLDMDRKNLFGAFTESFDLMREELKNAKEQEYAANMSKKELVASLSHDIKTPVASIKIISEVLLVKETQEEKIEKIHSIYESADRIDTLVTNLFDSTLQDLGELKVEVKDVYSDAILKMIKQADYKNRVTILNQPEGLVQMDPLRMEQVITNIIANSYKYADTEITISFTQEDEYLKISIKDYGPGVLAEEQPLIFQKFYRGKAPYIKEHKGAGLGLYICKYCMEKMGGSISCCTEEDGFVIMLYVLLSE